MPDGVNIPGGPSFGGSPQPPDVPCDPTGDGWRGPPGPVGPPGPQGIPGQPTAGGPFLPISGGTMLGPLNYTATGGSTSRSAQDRAADWVNVRDFGAALDGTTSDQTALTNAFHAAPANGVVYVPPGNINFGTFAPTSKPVLFLMSGNKSGSGAGIPITAIGNNIVESMLDGSTKYITRGSSTGISGPPGPVLRVDMTLNHATGTGGGIVGIYALTSTTAAATNNDFPFGMAAQVTLNQTADGGGPGCGGAFYCTRSINAGNAEVFGANLVATDATLRSSVNAGATVGCEIDLRANRLDDGTLADGWQLAPGPQSGARRFVLDLKYDRQSSADANPSSIAAFIDMGVGSTSLSMPWCSAKNGIFFGPMTYTFAGINFIRATFGTGAQAIALQESQTIGWTGDALTAVPTHWNCLQYRAATSRLYYVVNGVDQWSIDASGNVRARGTVTGSTTP